MLNNDIKFGVLGSAKIARTHWVPAINAADGGCYWGVASRSAEKAQAFSSEFGGKVYDTYEALLADPDIDAVYIPLPNDLHIPFCLQALAAGKHVLCEKPIALNREQCQTLVAASLQYPALKVMEAFMYRFHPQWQQVMEWISSGEIGQIKQVSTRFCYNNVDPLNIRNSVAAGGGALMDIGCYGISVARMVLGREPKRVVAQADIHPEFGVDDANQLMLDFSGAMASVFVSTKAHRSQNVTIEGNLGRIVLSHPFYCDEDDVRMLRLIKDEEEIELEFASDINHYQLMTEAFIASIQQQTPVPVSLLDSMANMAVIDAAVVSAQESAWVDVI